MAVRADFDAPLDLAPRQMFAQTYLQLRAYPVTGAVFAQLAVDDLIAAQATGRTLGEAIMNLGAMMAGVPVVPVAPEILREVAALERDRGAH